MACACSAAPVRESAPQDRSRCAWDLRVGHRLRVDEQSCTDCGRCHDACPGPGLDFSSGRLVARAQPGRPVRGLPRTLAPALVRLVGGPGGAACGCLRRRGHDAHADGARDPRRRRCGGGAHERGAIPSRPRASSAARRRTSLACRGSKYNVVAINTVLRRILDEPGRYALVGLPCHIQGLRLAQRRSRRLRERVVLTLGIFCGLTQEPRATAVLARQAGLDPAELRDVSYRGPGWPGGMRLVDRLGTGPPTGLSGLHRPRVHGSRAAALPRLPRRPGGARRRLRRRRLARPVHGFGRRERHHHAHSRRRRSARGGRSRISCCRPRALTR